MTRLLSVIGGALGRRVQHLLSATDLWQGSFSTVRNALRDGSSVLDRWLTAVKQLTGTFWTTEEHAWVGEPYVGCGSGCSYCGCGVGCGCGYCYCGCLCGLCGLWLCVG